LNNLPKNGLQNVNQFLHNHLFIFFHNLNWVSLFQEYLFDARFLTEGTVPNDRGCRICKKIGHLARNCPKSQKQQKVTQKTNNSPNNKQQQQQPQRREQERPVLKPQQQMPQMARPAQQQPQFRQIPAPQQGRPIQQPLQGKEATDAVVKEKKKRKPRQKKTLYEGLPRPIKGEGESKAKGFPTLVFTRSLPDSEF